MLRLIAEHARRQGRTLLTTECHDAAPDGPAFLERIGARKGLVEAVNQVRIADLDRGLIQTWLQRRAVLSPEFELGRWDGPYPVESLQGLVDLFQEVANDQPRDSLQMEDINYTPELMLQFDAEQRLGGDQRWTLFALHQGDRQLVGITEVFWNPNRPGILWQGFTGVMPAFRSRGLGRWLKAEMLARILRDRAGRAGHPRRQRRFEFRHAQDQPGAWLPAPPRLGYLAGGARAGRSLPRLTDLMLSPLLASGPRVARVESPHA